MSEYSKSTTKARSPLGGFVARFLANGYDNAHQARELLGEERAAKVLRGLSRLKLRAFEKGAIKLGAEVHDANAPHVGRFLAYVTLVLEQCQPQSRRACGRALYQGRTRRWNKETQRVEYIPVKQQVGGLAKRLGVCVREVQRYAKLAKVLELFESWQIKGRATVEALPKQMRGKRWSYAIYRWCGDLPRAAMVALEQWGRAKPSAGALALRDAPEPQRTGARSASLFVAMLARLDGPEPQPT